MFVWWSFTSQYPLLHHRPSFKTLSSVLHSHYNPTLCITAHPLHYSPPPLHHSPPFISVSSFPQSHHSPASTSVSSVLPSHHSPPFPSQPPFTSQFPFYIRFPIGLFTSELPFTLVSSFFPLHHSPTLYITVSPLTSVSSVPILQPHFPSQVSLLSQTYLTLLGRGREVQRIWTGSGAAQLEKLGGCRAPSGPAGPPALCPAMRMTEVAAEGWWRTQRRTPRLPWQSK